MISFFRVSSIISSGMHLAVIKPIISRNFGSFVKNDRNYNQLVNEELSDIEKALDEIADNVTDLDYSIASGVMSISMGSKGAYVINKQTPNKQIWWSSPISGPKRFEFDDERRKWYEVTVMDGIINEKKVDDDMNSLLKKEMKSLLDVDLHFN